MKCSSALLVASLLHGCKLGFDDFVLEWLRATRAVVCYGCSYCLGKVHSSTVVAREMLSRCLLQMWVLDYASTLKRMLAGIFHHAPTHALHMQF